MRLRPFLGACAFVFASAGCHDNVTVPTPGPPIQVVPVHGLEVVLMTVGPCLKAPCVAPDNRHRILSTVTLTNRGSRTVYLTPCGDGLRLILETQTGSAWMPEGPAILCPIDHGPIALASGASMAYNYYLPFGYLRFSVSVATDANGTDVLPAVSNVISTYLPI